MGKYILLFAVLVNILKLNAQEESTSPIKLQALYVGEFFSNFNGGIKTGQTYLGLIDFGIEISTEDIGLWKNGKFFALVENTHGGSPSGEYIGDMQVASNIENGDFTYLYELWYMQTFNKLCLKAGILDLNADCHVSDIGGLFINSSFGIMPSASLNMPVPIFPMPALGFQACYNFNEHFSLLGGVWDGNPGDFENNRYNIEWTIDNQDGFLYMLESHIIYKHEDDDLGRIKIGGLYHSGQFPDIADSSQLKTGNLQLHLIAEHTLIKPENGKKGKLEAFVQIGYLPDNSVSRMPLYVGGGLDYHGLFTQDGSDIIGLGFAHAQTSKTLLDNTTGFHTHETAIELSYALTFAEYITIQPNFQYIINPGADKNMENSFVGFLRFLIEI